MSSPANTTREDGDTVLAIISLGANLHSPFGTPRDVVEQALQALQALSPIPLRRSSCYLTAALDSPPDAPDFVNAIALLELPPTMSATALLAELHRIEASFGRRRGAGANLPRTLDLDLISFGDRQSQDPGLTLPHPRAHQRRFVLAPLAELAPSLRLPGQDQTVAEQLAALGEAQAIRRL